jgi:hypothetical protein
MVVISKNLAQLKVIKKEMCLQAKGPSKLSKFFGPKRHPNTWRQKETKELKDFMKVEKGGVHCKRIDGPCMKQCIQIPKATWTSPIFGKRSTCQTPYSKGSLMKDDVNDEMPNGNPKI